MANKKQENKLEPLYPKQYDKIKQNCISAEVHPHDRHVMLERRVLDLTDAYQREKLDNEFLRAENEELREVIKAMRRNGDKR